MKCHLKKMWKDSIQQLKSLKREIHLVKWYRTDYNRFVN